LNNFEIVRTDDGKYELTIFTELETKSKCRHRVFTIDLTKQEAAALWKILKESLSEDVSNKAIQGCEHTGNL
jgi:hypothetical protein